MRSKGTRWWGLAGMGLSVFRTRIARVVLLGGSRGALGEYTAALFLVVGVLVLRVAASRHLMAEQDNIAG